MSRLFHFAIYAVVAGSLGGQTSDQGRASTGKIARFTLRERFGVSHSDQPVQFSFSGGMLDRRTVRMLGPSGDEVPYQQLSDGNILIHTSLPASKTSTEYILSTVNPKKDTVSLNLNMLTGAYPAGGEVVRFAGSNLPGGLAEATDYFLKKISVGEYQLSRRKDLSDVVDITSAGTSVTMVKQGLIVDPDDPRRTFYAKSHHYRTGDPLWLKSTGALPVPLASDRPYFVIKQSEDEFRLASSLAGARRGDSIELTTTGGGIFETRVQWDWTLVSGQAASALPPQPVQLTDLGDSFNVTNGLTGFKVVEPAGNQSPFQRAPIQGIQLADGSWTAVGPNYLYEEASQKQITFATDYSLKVVESGPLLVRLEADYALNRPEYTNGASFSMVASDSTADTITLAGDHASWNGLTSIQFHGNGGTLPCGLTENKLYWPLTRIYNRTAQQTAFTLSDAKAGARVHISCAAIGKPSAQETMSLAGTGFFTEKISLYAGHKSIAIEDDTDSQVQYYLNFRSPTFVPNQARYRGHAASNLNCGYSLKNGAKAPYIAYTDAFVDITYDSAKNSSYNCDDKNLRFAPVWYLPNSSVNTGWYWELYDSKASSSSPLIGYYLGRTSRYITPVYAGPGVYMSPAHFAADGGPASGITMHVALRGPDGRSTQRTRREWALYVSTKADLRDPLEVQPIAVERDLIAGINLTHLANYVFEYPDPVGGWPPPYQEPATYHKFIERIQSDKTFRDHVWNTAPELRDLVSMWQGNSTADIELVVSRLEQFAFHWINILANQNGIFDNWWHYYQPGLMWGPSLTRALAVLNSEAATPAQRARTKAVAAFAASVFWDNDYVPWDVDSGEGSGTINQGDQYALYRAQSALMLPTQPLMAQKQAAAREYVESVYRSYLNPESGVPRGSTHYHGAAMDPALSNFLSLKNAGIDMNLYPQWKGYGRWMLDALTPPEPRFGNVRKMVSLGDGNTEASAMLGMVATLLRSSDPVLSAQLQWAWSSQNTPTNKTFGEFSAPSILVIDQNAPEQKPPLRSENDSGYWSVLRHGFATPNETVAWFINGDFYADHRHADSGQVTLYAHSAPLAVDWNANLYYPRVAGGLQHNRVVKASEIKQPWNADHLPLDVGDDWGAPSKTRFASFDGSSDAETSFVDSHGTVWTRGVTVFAPDPHYPVIYVRDRFSGPDRSASKVLTWNLMSEGSVSSPAGPYAPTERLNTGGTDQPNILPSNGPDYPLNSGLQHFFFTGQTWPAHPTKGIDWDLYLIPDGEQRFYIGAWGHNAEANREMSEYRTANGALFRESQRILRVHGEGSFSTIILPYRKGEAPVRAVTQQDCGVHIEQGKEVLCFGENGYEFSDGQKIVLTAFDAQPRRFQGISLSGGPVEIVLAGQEAKVTASGETGIRSISLPGAWLAPQGVRMNGSAYSFDYASDQPITFVFKKVR